MFRGRTNPSTLHAGLGSGYDDSAGAASDDPHLKKKRSWQGSRHRLEMAVTQGDATGSDPALQQPVEIRRHSASRTSPS